MSAVLEATTEVEAFERFCGSLTVESGAPMILEEFQRLFLADILGEPREVVILLPKGNAKSTTLAAVALFDVMTVPDAEVLILAASRDQAGTMLRQAAGFVRRSPALQERLTVKQREIVHRVHGGRVRVLASDVDTLDGAIPSRVLIDELHRHRRVELYSLMRSSLEKRGGRMATISTAGDDDETPLGQLRTKAYSLPVQFRDGAYRHAASADGAFSMHEWGLDASQDLDDLELVKTANPFSGVTLGGLRERHESPSMTAWAWARFACGAWVRGEDTVISVTDWDALSIVQIPNRSRVTVGLDLAWRGRDTTALVPVWWRDAGCRVLGDPIILTPPESGQMLSDLTIVDAIKSLCARFEVERIVYDPNAGGEQLAQSIARDFRLELVEHSQHDTARGLADTRLLEAIRRREIAHSGSTDMRAHALNATEQLTNGGGFRFSRPKHGPRRPIDALVAASMAHSILVSESEQPRRDDWKMF